MHKRGSTCPPGAKQPTKSFYVAQRHMAFPVSLCSNTPSQTAVRDPQVMWKAPQAVTDEKQNASITHPAHTTGTKPAAAFGNYICRSRCSSPGCVINLPSVPTIVGLFCRCARLLLCHCCVFSNLGSFNERKHCSSLRLCVPTSTQSQARGPAYGKVPFICNLRNSSCSLSRTPELLTKWEDRGVCLLAVA